MSDKIELGKLCGVLQSKFLCLSQSESRTQPCHVRICFSAYIFALLCICLSKNVLTTPFNLYFMFPQNSGSASNHRLSPLCGFDSHN